MKNFDLKGETEKSDGDRESRPASGFEKGVRA